MYHSNFNNKTLYYYYYYKAGESSSAVKGAKLFKLLPATLRNMNTEHIENFKCNLDSYLSQVPDQPTVAGQQRAAETKSLLHQKPMLNLNLNS